MTGENKDIGQQIIKSTKIALKDINSNNLKFIPEIQNQIQKKQLNLLTS